MKRSLETAWCRVDERRGEEGRGGEDSAASLSIEIRRFVQFSDFFYILPLFVERSRQAGSLPSVSLFGAAREERESENLSHH